MPFIKLSISDNLEIKSCKIYPMRHFIPIPGPKASIILPINLIINLIIFLSLSFKLFFSALNNPLSPLYSIFFASVIIKSI